MEVKYEDKSLGEESNLKVHKDRSKIYFFIIALTALLATNLYFYIKFRSSGEKLYTVTLQKESLEMELDRLEAELDNFYTEELTGSEELAKMESEARQTIANLRETLKDNSISEEDLNSAKQRVSALRDNVTILKTDVIELRVKNELLEKENERLNEQIAKSRDEIKGLTSENEALGDKIDIASYIKVSNLQLAGVHVGRRGNISLETKAKRIDKLQINFSLADNELSSKGAKEVYIRVINPQGSLIAEPNDVFHVHGEKLQYTQKEQISFTNNGEEYTFYWEEPDGFKKGAYTVLLYSNNAIMGRSSVIFR